MVLDGCHYRPPGGMRGAIPTDHKSGGQCGGGHSLVLSFLYREEEASGGFKWNRIVHTAKASGMWKKTKPRKEGRNLCGVLENPLPVLSSRAALFALWESFGSRSVHGTKNEQKEQRGKQKPKLWLGFGLALAWLWLGFRSRWW